MGFNGFPIAVPYNKQVLNEINLQHFFRIFKTSSLGILFFLAYPTSSVNKIIIKFKSKTSTTTEVSSSAQKTYYKCSYAKEFSKKISNCVKNYNSDSGTLTFYTIDQVNLYLPL